MGPKLRTNIDLRTFDGFIDSTRPSLEEEKARRNTRISAESNTVRLVDIQASIDLWDKFDALLFAVLLNSTILAQRQNKHVLERYPKKKEGHNLYMYPTAHLTVDKTSAKLKARDELNAILIPADAPSDMIEKSLENIKDLWPKVEGLVQTEKAMILHCISLFPEEHCTCKYLTNLQFAIDAGTSGGFTTMEYFIDKIVEYVAIEHRRHPPSTGAAVFSLVQRGGRGRGTSEGRWGRSQCRGRGGIEAKCRRCDMTCCSGDKCCVCDMTDEQVREMKIGGSAKFLIFVLRKWKADKASAVNERNCSSQRLLRNPEASCTRVQG